MTGEKAREVKETQSPRREFSVGSEAMSFGRDGKRIITIQHPPTAHTAAQEVGGKELSPPPIVE